MPHPTELPEKFALLKGAYIRLLNEKDVLLQWGKPQLEALYAMHIGRFQLDLLKAQLSIQALKRKLELVRSAINKGDLPDLAQIEAFVAVELANAEAQIMEQAAVIEHAKEVPGNLAGPERSHQLRQTFRELARQLHPDANPDLPPEYLELWHRSCKAYKSGDLEQLKALQVIYEKELAALKENERCLSEAELELRCATLKEGILLLEEELKKIRSVFPFTYEEQLKDEGWIKDRQEALQQERSQLGQYEQDLEEEYLKLKGIIFN